jgi:hypothetical protein
MPTDAAFTPEPTDPKSGVIRVGHLGSYSASGGFNPTDVCRIMDELWLEYLATHPDLFRRIDRKPR